MQELVWKYFERRGYIKDAYGEICGGYYMVSRDIARGIVVRDNMSHCACHLLILEEGSQHRMEPMAHKKVMIPQKTDYQTVKKILDECGIDWDKYEEHARFRTVDFKPNNKLINKLLNKINI